MSGNMDEKPAQQPWVRELSIMMQSVLFAAVRAPDGIKKDHPVKVIMRWYRRCVLMRAFEQDACDDPFIEGGGSFSGPFGATHFWETLAHHRPWIEARDSWHAKSMPEKWQSFYFVRDEYLRYVDELPHHFQLHLMHAAEIIGYHHPNLTIAEWWWTFYAMIVNDAHLFPETEEQLNLRLSDNPDEWRRREVVTAK